MALQTSRECVYCGRRTLHARQIRGARAFLAAFVLTFLIQPAFWQGQPVSWRLGLTAIAEPVILGLLLYGVFGTLVELAFLDWRCQTCGTRTPSAGSEMASGVIGRVADLLGLVGGMLERVIDGMVGVLVYGAGVVEKSVRGRGKVIVVGLVVVIVLGLAVTLAILFLPTLVQPGCFANRRTPLLRMVPIARRAVGGSIPSPGVLLFRAGQIANPGAVVVFT